CKPGLARDRTHGTDDGSSTDASDGRWHRRGRPRGPTDGPNQSPQRRWHAPCRRVPCGCSLLRTWAHLDPPASRPTAARFAAWLSANVFVYWSSLEILRVIGSWVLLTTIRPRK